MNRLRIRVARVRLYLLVFPALLLGVPAQAQSDQQIIAKVEEGIALSKARDFRPAIDRLQEALSMSEARHGPVHPFIAGCLTALADNYTEIGQYEKAANYLKRALAQSEQTLGAADYRNATILRSLSDVSAYMGRNEDGIAFAKRGLDLLIQNEKQDDPNLNALLLRMADCYGNKGDYLNAEKVVEKMLQLNPEDTGALGVLGSIRNQQGRFDEAKNVVEKALSISEKNGSDKFSRTTLLRDLAGVEATLENYDAALSLLKRAKRITEDSLGSEHPEVGAQLVDLARISSFMGDNKEAIDYSRQSLEILQKALDPDHLNIERAKTNLANYLKDDGGYEGALRLLEEAQDIRFNAGRANNNDAAIGFWATASAHFAMGDLNAARKDFAAALALLKENKGVSHRDYLACLGESAAVDIALGKFEEAKEKLLVADMGLGESSGLLAHCLYMLGETERARQVCREAAVSSNKAFARGLSMSERSRLVFQSRYASVLGPQVEILPAEEVADQLLLSKGRVLDSICDERAIADRASSDSAVKLLGKIKLLRARIGQLAVRNDPQSKAVVDELTEQLAAAQIELAKETTGANSSSVAAPNVRVSDVAKLLAPEQAFIDFFKYQDWKVSFTDGDKSTFYAAVVVFPQSPTSFLGVKIAESSPKTLLVKLGNSREIDNTIRAWREAIVRGNAEALEQSNATLYDGIWTPLAAALPQSTKQCIISPDGDLNFLSFAALAGRDQRFIGEEYDISYVASGRDLTKAPRQRISKSISIVSDPDFEAVSGSLSKEQQDDTKRFAATPPIKLERLPGTVEEAKALEDLAKASGWAVSTTSGSDATEASVTAVQNPSILHLATHGFYLNVQTGASAGARGMSVRPATLGEVAPAGFIFDPMRASGIALAGAQQTLDAWAEGRAPKSDSDGVLTAEEIASLDLKSTWLVTLSACESGVGEARSGEGVFGMRRAFRLAGTDNLLMTLWPVNDEATAKFMADFYKEALVSGDAPSSLAKVQRDWLVKLREERGLTTAVRDAGAFAVVMMSNPRVKSDMQPVANTQAHDPEVQTIHSATPEQASPGIESHPNLLTFDTALAKADAGDAYAQAIVSIYYGLGFHTAKDISKSAEYALKSASAGHPLGIYRVGVMRENGEGIAKDVEQARTLKLKAFDGLNEMTNDPYALTALGVMVFKGDVAQQDRKEAARLYRIAADAGYAPAQYNYAACLFKGHGVEIDEQKALRYWEEAMAQNYPPALKGPPR